MTSTFYKHSSISTTPNDGYLMEEELQLDNYHCSRRHQRNYDYQQQFLSGLTTREASPDSVMPALDWHFSSLFSSSAASADRCSDASDTSLHLAGSVRERWSGGPDPDPDPNKTGTASVHHKQDSRFYSKRIVKAKAYAVQKEDHDCHVEKDEDEIDVEEEHNLPIYSARSAFSLALKECRERRSRSEAPSRKSAWNRPVDFNYGIASSPTMGAVKAGSTGSRKSCTFPSPGTPNYWNPSIGLQKGWSSERVPLRSYAGMKNGGSAYLPFNHNGRTLPSKWEDAERWIFSPVSTDNFVSPSVPQPQRRPKSKSGPLGAPGVAYYSLYSPAMAMYGEGNMGNLMDRSSFCAGVMGAEGFQTSGSQGISYQVCAKHCMGRSVSIRGYSDPLDKPSYTVPEDENLDKQKNAATDISRTVSRRDMATQMSPLGSTCSSPKRTISSSGASPHDLQILELSSVCSPKLEMKDVLVDERVITRRSKKSKYRIPEKSSGNSDEWKTKDADVQSCVRDTLDPEKSISKAKREEAKITTWENLQNAKAEAAIRKLEMKLEKKRSSSMDKIMKKLRSAQKRAQDMRSTIVSNQDSRTSNNPHKALIFHRAHPVGSLGGCFTCHAF